MVQGMGIEPPADVQIFKPMIGLGCSEEVSKNVETLSSVYDQFTFL